MKAINEDKDREISSLTAENAARDDQNAGLRSEIADLDARLAAERDQGWAMKGDIDWTHHGVQDLNRQNAELTDWVRNAENELAHS